MKGWAVIMMLLFVVAGCKKEDEPPEFEQIGFDTQVVMDRLPTGLTNATDEYAQECVDMIESALDMSDFIGHMDVPSDAVKTSKKGTSGTWSWTWSYMNEIWTFFWTYDEDNTKRYWTMEIQYGGGPIVDYITAWEMLDGSAGEIVYNFNWAAIYYGEEDYVDLDLKIVWELDSEGTYYYSWYWEADSPEYTYLWRYDIVVYADGSGYIDYYLMDEIYYHMEWDAQGNGSWIYYIIQMQGTWTAG